MLENIYQIPYEESLTVKWQGYDLQYDLQLYELGQGYSEFFVINPNKNIPEKWKTDLKYYVEELPDTRKCIVIAYEGDWIVKIFKDDWYPYHGYETVEIVKTRLVWTRNSDIDKLITYEDDPFGTFEPNKWDRNYKLVWYIDPRFNPLDDKVWAFSCQPIGREILGTKDMGYVVPDVLVEFNDYLPDLGVDANDCCPPFYDLAHECAYELDPIHQTNDERLWVIKFTPLWRNPKEWKWLGTITPEFTVVYNPELPKLDYDLDYTMPWHDFTFEHVWMLDRKHLKEGEDDIWVFTVQVTEELEGSKIIDYVSPNVKVVYNPILPNLEYDIDYTIPWHDLAYEHVWMLDDTHLQNNEEPIWALKASATKKTKGSKIIEQITPIINVEYNPNLPKLEYDIDYTIPWHDLAYDQFWMLDKKHLQNNEEPIWALKASATKKTKGSKVIGQVSPKVIIEYNLDLPKLEYNEEYTVPWHDFAFEHVWYLDSTSKEKIWTVRAKFCNKPIGEKEVGLVTPVFADYLDVIFISYNEPNADENWNRVLEKAPWAKRVHGVEGIFNAHKAAAKLAKSDMFFVVDGDAWLVDDWQFDFQPGIFDRDCAYVWSSINPVNNLTYQNGGVKLFNKAILMQQKKWITLDMFTGIMPKIKAEDEISCITTFNVDEFSTWRSAFRECVKLYITNQMSRLSAWLNSDVEKPFGEFAVLGAWSGSQYAKENKDNHAALLQINDYAWLKKTFKAMTK
jgi:hypothetical protein